MITGAILLAVVAWAFAFGLPYGSFWVRIGVAVSAVCAYAWSWQRPSLRLRWRSVADGVGAAAALYGVFWVGNALAPFVVSGAHQQVGGIYGLGADSSMVWVFLLLFCVTGPGEEIFWRGFLQDRLAQRLGREGGFAAATLLYSVVHIFSGNLMLILAALVAGAWWGALYAWRRDLLALIVSHSVWSALIFTVAPIR